MTGPTRRKQVLETAASQFALTGLHGTTTAGIARNAGISEPILYAHFSSKEGLFRAAVEENVHERLRALHSLLARIPRQSAVHCIERMAQATVGVCLSTRGQAMLTNWALLENPEQSSGLCREEVCTAGDLWNRELARLLPSSRSREVLSESFVQDAVHACLAYGFWLAALRYDAKAARPRVRRFAGRVALAASTLLART